MAFDAQKYQAPQEPSDARRAALAAARERVEMVRALSTDLSAKLIAATIAPIAVEQLPDLMSRHVDATHEANIAMRDLAVVLMAGG